MSIVVQQITYIHPDNDVLFQNVNFTLNKGQKVALVGVNGSGKSTLLHIIAGGLKPTEGDISTSSIPYYVPQHFGQYNHQTIAQALQIEKKLKALQAIIAGDASIENFTNLDDDWNIEERSVAALSDWGIDYLQLNQEMGTLSGGEKTKVFLAGLQIHTPDIILMDEPTNHMDSSGRQKLYDFVKSGKASILLVSHDITLLRLLPLTYELTSKGITVYGGNYDFYKEQKELQLNALQTSLEAKEKELRVAKKVARETAERKQKLDARGKKLSEKKGISKLGMGKLKETAEKSTNKLTEVHAEKSAALAESVNQLRNNLPNTNLMKVDFSSSNLHTGKILIKAHQINFAYNSIALWDDPLNFTLRSGDRIAIKGDNGAGKTTLIKLITGELQPITGTLEKADFSYVYIDQEYSIIQNELTVYEQAQEYNTRHFLEHEIKMLLSRYLFPFDTWNKPCSKLSGGEKMRLVFCCLMISNQTPDIFILDEPTNNLDIHSIEIITAVIREYKGTILVISHDQYFMQEIGVDKSIEL